MLQGVILRLVCKNDFDTSPQSFRCVRWKADYKRWSGGSAAIQTVEH